MTVFTLYGLDVVFPYELMYPEQKEFMEQIKLSLDDGGPCILELPAGSGRSICVFSIVLSYLKAHKNFGPFVYAVNSLPAFERAVSSLRLVEKSRKLHFENEEFRVSLFVPRSVGCTNKEIKTKQGGLLARCAKNTLPWAEAKCPMFVNTGYELPQNVLDIEDLLKYSNDNQMCAFHLARRAAKNADVIICSSEELIGTRSGMELRKILGQNPIIVFDDANCIDNICCDSLSFYFNLEALEKAKNGVKLAKNFLKKAEEKEQDKLNNAYEKLKEGIKISDVEEMIPESLDIFKHPVLEEHRSERCIPGTLRNNNVFLARLTNLMKFFECYFKNKMEIFTKTSDFLHEIRESVFIEPETLHFMTTRLTYFLASLNITEITELIPIYTILDFVAVLSTYDDNCSVFYDTINPNNLKLREERFKTIQITCFDASLVFSQILPFKRIVLTGETISPLDMYPQILSFDPVSRVDSTISTNRNNVLPIIVARGTDQTLLTSSIELSKNLNATNNYGRLMTDIVKIIPDGIIGFFPSYSFMYEIIEYWSQTDVLKNILEYKTLFIETPDPQKTALLIDNYKRAIDNGKGGVFFGIVTGFSPDGIDFSGPYGRCCILFGLPEPQKFNSVIKSRAEFLDKKFQISKETFQSFNSMRMASRCFSKVLSSKSDYSIILLADSRYEKENYITNLPSWVRKCITKNQLNQSVDDSVEQAKAFFLKMTQPFKHSSESFVLSNFQSWCKIYNQSFNQYELQSFITFIHSKDEFIHSRLDDDDLRSESGIYHWFANHWSVIGPNLLEYHNEWMREQRR